MTTTTRGRGWARARDPESTNVPGSLRRPGQPLQPQQLQLEPQSPVENEAPKSAVLGGAATGDKSNIGTFSGELWNDICQSIEHLVLREQEYSGKKLDDLAARIPNAPGDDETLWLTFDELYKRAIEDRSIGIRLATVFADKRILSIQTLKGMSFRYMFLQALQEDYNKHEETRKSSEEQFLNTVSLLGQVYYRMRIGDGTPIKALGLPVLQYLSILLEMSSLESLELLGTLMNMNGKMLQEAHRAEMEKLVNQAREALLNRKLDSRCKCILLYIIEAANRSYDPPSSEQRQFYLTQVGSNVLARLEGKDEKDFPQILSNTDKNAQFEDAERNTTGGNIPRAIRGSGANEQNHPKNHQKNEKFARRPPGSSSRSNNHSSHWGHDDRFSKDYD